jgi:hypothetical protein
MKGLLIPLESAFPTPTNPAIMGPKLLSMDVPPFAPLTAAVLPSISTKAMVIVGPLQCAPLKTMTITSLIEN